MIGANKKFVQCFSRMRTENFQYDVNIEGVMKQDETETYNKKQDAWAYVKTSKL